MHDRTHVLNRLRRIEGQVRGIAAMIEDERYCIDVLTQVRAARAALARVETALKDHSTIASRRDRRATPPSSARKPPS